MERIFIYARGGDLTIDSNIIASDDVRLYSTGTVGIGGNINTVNFSSFSGGTFLSRGGLVTAGGFYITSLANIFFDTNQFSTGNFTEVSLSLNAAASVNIALNENLSVFNLASSIFVTGHTINFFGSGSGEPTTLDLNVTSPAIFEAGAGGINASNVFFMTVGGLNLISEGDINIYGAEIPFNGGGRLISGIISAGGAFNATSDVTTGDLTAGSTVSVGGNLFVVNVTAGETIDVAGSLSGFGTATAGGNITADRVAIPTIFSPTGVLFVGAGGIHPFVATPGGSDRQHTITISSIVSPNGIDFSGNQFGGIEGLFAGGRLTINADTLTFDVETGIGEVNFNGADGFGNSVNPPGGGGGDGGIFTVNTTGDITVSENISATTGLNDPEFEPVFSGAGGKVTLDSADGMVAVTSTIQVSSNDQPPQVPAGIQIPLRRSASGGEITLHSGITVGTAITLSESSRLLSLLNEDAPGPGGTIRVLSDGGNIFADGEIVADRGTIIISNIPSDGPHTPTGGSLVSIDGNFAFLSAETVNISSGGDLTFGLETAVPLDAVTISLFAINNVNVGDFYSAFGKGSPVPVFDSTGDVTLEANGTLSIGSIYVARENAGVTEGLNLTLDAQNGLMVTNDVNLRTDASGLDVGGNIRLTAGGNMNLGGFTALQIESFDDTGVGANISLSAGGTMSSQALAANIFLSDVSLGNGGNITLESGDDATFTNSFSKAFGLSLRLFLSQGATIGTGGNIMVTVDGNLDADGITAYIAGLGAIAQGGNIRFNISGDMTSRQSQASFVIDLPETPERPFNPSGLTAPLIDVSAANITVGNSDFQADFTSYINDIGGSNPPTGTVGSVLIQTSGSIDVFGSLNVLGTIDAAGDIHAETIASTNVNSATLIAAGFGGIAQFGFQDFARPADILHILSAPVVTSRGGIFFDGVNASGDFITASNGGSLTINADSLSFGEGQDIDGTVSFNGGDGSGVTGFEGANGGTFTVNTSGPIDVQNSIEATTGRNPFTAAPSGIGGNVNLNSTAGTITIDSRIEVSSADPSPSPTPRRRSNSGGNIRVTSAKAGTVTGRAVAVNVTNSSQLLALLDAASTGPGGKITILATGANSDVNVNGRAEATRGTIDIRHEAAGGHVNIGGTNASGNSATMSADIIKARALGANGQLNIGNSTLSADRLIRLYAPGSNGELNFIANTTLSSGSRIDLAGSTVTIQPSVSVLVLGNGGPANVYTNNPNYNTGIPGVGNPGNGSFTGNGANAPLPLAAAPGFDDPPAGSSSH